MRWIINTARRREKGAALPLVAGMLAVLIALTAFAVDLGWFYLNASRIQKAADAGALAGVIRMPYEFNRAVDDARATAKANGYEHGVDDVEVIVEEVPSDPNQIDVTVTDTVDTFFARIFGMETVTITRSARAEFIPPLRMGSPTGTFGNECNPKDSGCKRQPNFWANIHGVYTSVSMGDAFGPACNGTSGSKSCTQNPSYRERGYLYGIEPNGPFEVQFIDIVHRNIADGENCPGNTSGTPDYCTSDHMRTGDRGCEDWTASSHKYREDCGQPVIVNLYEPSPNPMELAGRTPICTHTFEPEPQVAANDPYVWERPPKECFTVNSPKPGVYVLQVKLKEPARADYSGLNRYSVKTTSGKIYGLGDISLYNNFKGSSTEFWLAEVPKSYAGKTFVVELFDPGDAESGVSNIMQVLGPGGVQIPTCQLNTRPTVNHDWVPLNTKNNNPVATPCQLNATRPDNNFDNKWVQVVVNLPSDYDCSDCWWKIRYNFSGTTEDTTTWRAYIVGNPIHLIPQG